MEANVAIPDALWDEWLAMVVGDRNKRLLLTSLGEITPSKEQWRRATRAMRDAGCKIAVVTESKATSALAKAASWAGTDMQAFRWEQLYDASMFLGLDTAPRQAVRVSTLALRDAFNPAAAQPAKPAPPTTTAPPSRPAPSPSPASRPTPTSSASASASSTFRSTASSGPANASRPTRAQRLTPMADAASKNLAQVRQTSEEIQAKLAEVQARLRNRSKTS